MRGLLEDRMRDVLGFDDLASRSAKVPRQRSKQAALPTVNGCVSIAGRLIAPIACKK